MSWLRNLISPKWRAVSSKAARPRLRARTRTVLRVELLEARDVPSAIPLFEMSDPAFGPAIPVANDSAPNELGVKFTVFQPGTVGAIQFYRGAPSDSGFDVHLWDTGGTLLGTGHAAGNQAPGWQVVDLDQPVHLAQFHSYLASYYSATGGYADTYEFFSGHDWVRGPVIANQDGQTGGEVFTQYNNGFYHYGEGGGFPNATYRGSNYWVGPIFEPDATTNAPPVITSLSQGTAPTSGGGTLTIHGANLLLDGHPLPTIYIGGQQATIPPGVLDPNTITVTIPAHAAGTVDVRVITDAGESDITAADQLTYVAPTVSSSAIPLFDMTDPTFVPAIPFANDSAPNELGVKFSVAVPGTVSAIQFYRGAPSGSGFDVHLWDSDGNLLGTGTVGGNQAPGWQVVALDQPVHLDPDVIYVASYYTSTGGYADTYNFFTGTSWSQGPLSAWPSGAQAGGNGVYHYGLGGGFPDASYRDSNYWVGPIFQPDSGAVPTVTGLSQSNSPTSGGTVLTITGTNFSSGHVTINFGDTPSINFTVVNANTLAALIPAHAAGTIDVRVVTDAGASPITAADRFTFTAGAISPTAVTLFETADPSFAPAIPVADDSNPQELGVKFTAFVPGSVTAIQFYRGAPSGSGFSVHLWDGNGTLLGSGQVSENEAPGWQTVALDHPVHLDPTATYVASYYTPTGGYADTYDFFATNGVSRGPLLAFSSASGSEGGSSGGPNGVFVAGLGGGFPHQSYRDSNYWVSPVFEPDPSVGAAPVITSITPNSAQASAGVLLTINGANFTPDAISPAVYFGNVRANIQVYSANQIFVTVPDHSVGTVHVRVLTDAGESALMPWDVFTFTF